MIGNLCKIKLAPRCVEGLPKEDIINQFYYRYAHTLPTSRYHFKTQCTTWRINRVRVRRCARERACTHAQRTCSKFENTCVTNVCIRGHTRAQMYIRIRAYPDGIPNSVTRAQNVCANSAARICMLSSVFYSRCAIFCVDKRLESRRITVGRSFTYVESTVKKKMD